MGNAWIQRFLIFAADGNPQPQSPWDSMLPTLGFLAIIFIFFYFIMMRPQSKERQKRQEMLANIKKNDRVLTIGGVYGIVVNVHREADEVILKVDEANNTKLRVTLSSIARVLSGTPAEEAKSE
jgi:preprotein translocase subunit YajC